MVLDNADDLDTFFAKPTSTVADIERTRPLSNYLPHNSQGLMLITTRDKRISQSLAGIHASIIVQPMGPSEAEELLRSQLKESHVWDNEDSGTLIDTLEYIPLAITQAAAFISENNLNLAEYLELLHANDSEVQYLLDKDLGDLRRDSESQNSVIRTWKLSFDLISKQNPRAAEMLSFMAVIDRQGVSKSLLDNKADSKVDIVKALGTLQAFSLITVENNDADYQLHRLMQLATRKWLELQGTKEKWQEQALLVLSDKFPSGKFGTWPTCESFLPHAQTVIRYKVSTEKHLEQYACLLGKMARFDREQGRYEIACTRNSAALEVLENIFGLEHSKTLGSMANLAWTYWHQGQWNEAEKLSLRVMEARIRVLGEEHPDTLESMSNLASTYRNQGRWDEAEKLSLRVMEARIRVLGEEHPDTLESISNLASTYRNQGRWDKAEQLNMQVMEMRTRVLGEEHPDTLICMSNLASTYSDQGRWDEAEELEVQVLKISTRVLGEEHPNTLITMHNLAWTYHSQERHNEAITLMRKVVHLRTKNIGAHHPNTLKSIESLKDWSDT